MYTCEGRLDDDHLIVTKLTFVDFLKLSIGEVVEGLDILLVGNYSVCWWAFQTHRGESRVVTLAGSVSAVLSFLLASNWRPH